MVNFSTANQPSNKVLLSRFWYSGEFFRFDCYSARLSKVYKNFNDSGLSLSWPKKQQIMFRFHFSFDVLINM